MSNDIEGEYPDGWGVYEEIRHYIAMRCFSKLTTTHHDEYECKCNCPTIFAELEQLNILDKI